MTTMALIGDNKITIKHGIKCILNGVLNVYENHLQGLHELTEIRIRLIENKVEVNYGLPSCKHNNWCRITLENDEEKIIAKKLLNEGLTKLTLEGIPKCRISKLYKNETKIPIY